MTAPPTLPLTGIILDLTYPCSFQWENGWLHLSPAPQSAATVQAWFRVPRSIRELFPSGALLGQTPDGTRIRFLLPPDGQVFYQNGIMHVPTAALEPLNNPYHGERRLPHGGTVQQIPDPAPTRIPRSERFPHPAPEQAQSVKHPDNVFREKASSHAQQEESAPTPDLLNRLQSLFASWKLPFNPQSLLQDWRRLALMALCILIFLTAGYKLISYAADYFSARQASQELRDAFYTETQPLAATDTPLPEATAAPAAASAEPTIVPPVTPSPEPSAVPEATPSPVPANLPAQPYPNNPFGITSDRFNTVRRMNQDIIGWLKIDGVLDEPVVQRDNSYYLRRDYQGRHNDNGAVFLDEACQLNAHLDTRTLRPYTLMLYAHNMKTGAMFGSLRNYENISFYKKNPFVSFDTLYEDGRFVIFAASVVSIRSKDVQFLHFYGLNSTDRATRAQAIAQLKATSRIQTNIDVKPEDQILLLITCVDNDNERRVVAARRIRSNESETSLNRLVQKAHSW